MKAKTLDEALEDFALNREADYAATLTKHLRLLSDAIAILHAGIMTEYGANRENVALDMIPDEHAANSPIVGKTVFWHYVVLHPWHSARVLRDFVSLTARYHETVADSPPRAAARLMIDRVRTQLRRCSLLQEGIHTSLADSAILEAQTNIKNLMDWMLFANQIPQISMDMRVNKIIPKQDGAIKIELMGGKAGRGAPRDLATRHLLSNLKRLRGDRSMDEMINEAAELIVRLDFDEKPPARTGEASQPKRPKSVRARVSAEVKRLRAALSEPAWGKDFAKAKDVLQERTVSMPSKAPFPSTD